MKKKTKNSSIDVSGYPPKKHESGADHYILVDGMNIAYQAFHAYKRLSYKGKSVSILFGFLQILKSKIKNHCWTPEKIIIIWDGDISEKRLEWWPKYKSHRQEKRDKEEHKKFHKQIRKTQKLIRAFGIAQIRNKKIEGDDMICLATKYYSALGRITIFSGDHDMVQLVNRDIQVFHPIKGTITAPGLCSAHFGVEAMSIVDLYCLTGDDSDDIPGIKGFGPRTAIKFLKEHNSIAEYLKNKKAEFNGLLDKDRLKKIYKRNKKLMDLKWFCNKFLTMEDITYIKGDKSPKFNDSKVSEICLKYNLKTLNTLEFKGWWKAIQKSSL